MENVFLTHAGGLGIGHVTERRAVAFAASAITNLPTHPKISGNFVISLVSHLSRGMLCVHSHKFGIKVRLQRSALHGYQWCVRIVLYHNSR